MRPVQVYTRCKRVLLCVLIFLFISSFITIHLIPTLCEFKVYRVWI